MATGFRMAGEAMEGPQGSNYYSGSGYEDMDKYWKNQGSESPPPNTQVQSQNVVNNPTNSELSDWTKDQYINTKPQDPPSGNGQGQGPPKPVPGPGPAPVKDTMYDFGGHDASVHGDGIGFGKADLDYMLGRGAKEENIKKYMQDYQNTGGRVGSRAAAWAGMQNSEGQSIGGHDPSRGMGAWWRDREGGSVPEVNYDYSLHDAEAHGGAGIGKVDIEAMRRGGASNENIKKYIRDYARQGGIIGRTAASFGGVKENHTAPGAAFHPGSNLGEWWTNRDRSKGIGTKPPKAPADSTGSGAGNSRAVAGSGGGSGGNGYGGAGGNNITLSGDAFTRKWGGSFRNNTSGLETANRYIQYAKDRQAWDSVALDKRIQKRPQYHKSQGDVYQSQWGGDMWKNGAPSWTMPEPLSPVKTPDLSGEKYLDMIKDIG